MTDITLPELPEPIVLGWDDGGMCEPDTPIKGYTATQVRAFARSAVEANRAMVALTERRPYGYCVEQGSPEFSGYYSGHVSRIVSSKHDAEQILKQWNGSHPLTYGVYRLLELRAVPIEPPAIAWRAAKEST
jgi:hypothetical protein